ncbi:MAG: methyltransferase domain-containing protein [Actinobacteria bacterium]|nr:methyltransferase domain-containing protein [Actinomycetota bacterium]
MKRQLVDTLVCPISSDPLELVSTGDTGDEIEFGELLCNGCGLEWPIHGGIPRMVPPDLVDQQRKTAASFGWQWQHFVEMHPEFEAQFLDWIHPLDPASFRGKRVLDAGCGIGRHAYYAASYGAREVVAIDLSGAVETARMNLAGFDDVHVVQGDLLRPPFREAASGGGFDVIYSIGVLHHLPDPYLGFQTLLRYLRPGGTIAVWVYGYENNGFVRNVVEPLRRVSTRIPPTVLRGLAWPLALGFHAAAKGVYRPLHGTRLGRSLPLDQYLASVADFGFRQNYGIVFDQLVAPTAAYITGPELEGWFRESGLEDVQVSHRHENSWRGRGRVPAVTD